MKREKITKLLFEEMTKDEVKKAANKNSILLLPVGAIEEHGPHLPVKTDTYLAEGICMEAAKKIKDQIPILIAPSIWWGYVMQDSADYPGAVYVGVESFINGVTDVCESLLKNGFQRIIVVNGHGHNPGLLNCVSRRIRDKYRISIVVIDHWNLAKKEISAIRKSEIGGMMHACELETGLMLAIRPDLVDMSKAVKEISPVVTKYVSTDMMVSTPVSWSRWDFGHPKSGVMGDPTVATRESGKQMLMYISNALVDFIKEYHLITAKRKKMKSK